MVVVIVPMMVSTVISSTVLWFRYLVARTVVAVPAYRVVWFDMFVSTVVVRWVVVIANDPIIVVARLVVVVTVVPTVVIVTMPTIVVTVGAGIGLCIFWERKDADQHYTAQ